MTSETVCRSRPMTRSLQELDRPCPLEAQGMENYGNIHSSRENRSRLSFSTMQYATELQWHITLARAIAQERRKDLHSMQCPRVPIIDTEPLSSSCFVVLHTCFSLLTWKVENNSAWSTRTSTLWIWPKMVPGKSTTPSFWTRTVVNCVLLRFSVRHCLRLLWFFLFVNIWGSQTRKRICREILIQRSKRCLSSMIHWRRVACSAVLTVCNLWRSWWHIVAMVMLCFSVVLICSWGTIGWPQFAEVDRIVTECLGGQYEEMISRRAFSMMNYPGQLVGWKHNGWKLEWFEDVSEHTMPIHAHPCRIEFTLCTTGTWGNLLSNFHAGQGILNRWKSYAV